MKKTLLFGFAMAIATVVSHAQITQLIANKDLDFIAAVGTTKAIFVSNTDQRLYVSDGTVMGTFSLSASITYNDVVGTVGNKVLFRGTNATVGSELFSTDGTPSGTGLVKDLYPGISDSDIGYETAFLNGFVYFTAVTPTEGREIWKSDGTAAGTTLLKDIVAGAGSSNISGDYNLFSNGSYLLFSAQVAGSGYELWKSDGTTAGTSLLKDINPGTPNSRPDAFFALGNIVLFRATTAAAGRELWKTDGTAAGTAIIKDISPGTGSSNGSLYDYFYEFNGRAFFDAVSIDGEELWSTDGTTANTKQVKNIEPGSAGSLNLVFNAITVGNKFIFPSSNLFGTRYELWQSDGTEAGTFRIKDFSTGDFYPLIMNTYNLYGGTRQSLFQGNKFFLYGGSQQTGTELWVSDGTEAGTTMVKDINPGAESGLSATTFQYTQDALYFTADDGVHGLELWKTNGTANGTSMVMDIQPGADSSKPELWPIFNNKLTFSANSDNTEATELFVVIGNFSPLPVKLGDLTVKWQGSDGVLNWNTLQEINTREFIVQRSTDGTHFQNIGTIQAAGQSNSKQSYTFTDADVNQHGKSLLYYRLQVVDKDGRSELTKVVSLQLSGSHWSMKLVSNPVQSSLSISLTGTSGITSFKIADLLGKSLTTATYNGSGIIHIPVQNLPAGIYLLTAENDKGGQTVKFVKN